ncbi:MAG: MurR/RpiR family transcriptional regulator [Christensenellales bacterium]|jgi:DNA-binding MurR/RpiR family transcriptional regulator
MQGNDIIKIIKEQQSTMSKGHKAIASYIIDHYETAAFITASKLGDKVGVSESTVVRFACAVGFDGYPELQKNLQELIKTKLTNVQRMGLRSGMAEEDLIRSALRTDITSLRHIREVLDYQMVEKVADTILDAQNVYIMGLRSSAPLAEFFWYYLNYIIDNASLVVSGIGDVFGQLMHAKKGDLVIGISFPRYTSRTVDGAVFAKNNGAKIIAITDNDKSPLAKISDSCLFVNSDMNLFVDSLVAPLSVINTIILLVGMRKKDGLKHNFEMLEDLWRKHEVYTIKEETE